jgi:hypothetical protein
MIQNSSAEVERLRAWLEYIRDNYVDYRMAAQDALDGKSIPNTILEYDGLIILGIDNEWFLLQGPYLTEMEAKSAAMRWKS